MGSAPASSHMVPAFSADAGDASGSPHPPLRVLLVEDSIADADVIAEYFAPVPASDGTIVIDRVDRISQAVERLAMGSFDVVLLDLSLPDARGLEGVERICMVAPDVPVVVMTGLSDDRLAIAAVQAGAQDYLIKGQDGARVVRRAVRYGIERHRLRRERETLLAREHAAREAAERSARVRDEVLGIVSHDLRTPLSTMLMTTSALTAHGDPDVVQLADVIRRSSQWALRIIRDLLDVTAIEAGHLSIHRESMTVQAITDTIETMFTPLAADAAVRLVIDRRNAPRWVDVDVDRIVQAVGNLVGNAIKFTPRDGQVSLVVAGDDQAVWFRVADTGRGIPVAHLPHLFDRFWQARATRRGGAGLGLTIAKGIAEGHGGRLEVESAVDQGSTFTVWVPNA